ncbi:MAG: cytochrome c [Acidimicrobiia bacterium]|jgi:cytochrome c oxidase subunit 2|nr:cytochrome c [Acidimicrobiia bacterium]
MPELEPGAQQGFDIAQRNGCTSCHGPQGQGGVAPAFLGLAGSDVQLDDGTTVVADASYLKRSITDPGAQKVAGYTIEMPTLSLSASEVDQIVTYLEAVGVK